MATNTDFIVKNGLVVTDSSTFGNTITGTNAVFTGSITASNILDSADVIGIIASEGLDSNLVTSIVDSAYVKLRDRFQDSGLVTSTVTKAYVDALNIDADTLDGQTGTFYLDYTNFTNTPNVLDSANIINLVDSALVQLKAIGLDYNVLSNKPASGLANVVEDTTPQLGGPLEGNGYDIFLSDDDILAWGASPGRTNIQGKASTSYSTNYIKFNVRSGSSQSSEVARLTVDDGLYTTIGLNFANWNTALNDYYDLKIKGPTQNSLSANELIRFPESSGTVALTKDLLDSADIINLIDSAYIQARQTTGGGGTVDSAYVLSVVDSAAVPFTQKFYHFTADSGQKTFSGYDDDSDTLAYSTGALAVYLNGILLVDSVDYTASTGTSIVLTDSATLGDVLTVLKFGGNTTGLDSTNVINLIDSAYIQARQLDIYRDSAFITNIIDSAYIAARTTAGTDSAAIIQLIDSAYVQARQTDVYRDSAFVDLVIEKHLDLGEFILGGDPGVLQYVDFVSQVAGTNGAVRAGSGLSKTGGTGWTSPAYFSVDSSFVTGLIDSAYIQARDRYRDSAFVTNIIDSAYVEARQSNVFNRVYVSGQTEFNADSTRDQIIFEAGTGITLTTDANTDTLTITGHDPAFPDSASVVTVITNTVDSAYVQLRQSAVAGGGGGTDSATVITLINSTVDSDYIGTKVDFTRGEFTTDRSQYTATASQTVFNHSSKDPANLDVYLNGILQVVNDDYTANSSAVTFTTGVDSGYSVSIVERRGRILTQRGLVESKYYFTTSTPTTSITGTDDNGATLDYSDGFLDVYLNGILLKDSDDYSTNSGTTVTLVSATDSNDLVTLINRKGVVVSPNVKNYEFTATAGQTTFSGSDINSNTLAYVPGAVQVHLNGILLRNADFTAVNGTSVTLATSASLNDELVVSAFSNPGQNMDLYKFTADSGQTIFSGNDLTGASLAYQPGNIQVFMNGLLLNDSDDYTASNGMSVVLTSGADLSDEIKIASFVTNRDNIRTNAWSAPTDSTVQASAGDKLFIDVSSSAKTVTLPSSATMGDEIRIIDATGNAATNNITVGRNGHKIQGSATDLTININRAGIGLVYYNAAQGWVLIEN